MKRIFTLAAATLLLASAAFAHEGKKCGKGKDCCKKEAKKEAKSADAKEAKPAAEAKKP